MDNGVPVINNVTLNKATLEKLRNAKTEEEVNDLYEKLTGITREEYEKLENK